LLKLREKYAPATLSDDDEDEEEEDDEGDIGDQRVSAVETPRNRQRSRLTSSSEVDLSIVKLSGDQALELIRHVPKDELDRLSTSNSTA
jgi:hypothetical protein